jgi:DNA-binding transcriptional ArsR family regulator
MDQSRADKAEAIFHPVRIRIVQALFGGARLTPARLARAAGPTPIATLYRHLNRLARAGIVVVVEERQVRGTVERTYALADERAANVSRAELRRLSRKQLLRHFGTLVASLLGDYGRYLAERGTNVVRDGVVVRQEALSLTRADAERVRVATLRAIRPFVGHAEGRGRRRYRITTLLVPDAKTRAAVERAPVRHTHRRSRDSRQ